MNKYIIEREIAAVEQMTSPQFKDAATASNAVLCKLAPRIQWVHSYVTKDKLFCIYLAEDEDVIRAHATMSGFPATRITQVSRVIEPTTATA